METGHFVLSDEDLRMVRHRFLLIQFMSFIQLLSPLGVMFVAGWLIFKNGENRFLHTPILTGVVLTIVIVELLIYRFIFRPKRALLQQDIVEKAGDIITGPVIEKSVRNRRYTIAIGEESFAVSFSLFSSLVVGQQAEVRVAHYSRFVFSGRLLGVRM